MTRSSPRTIVAALLLVSLTALCLSELVEAATPNAEHMHRGSLLCDAAGCVA